MRALGERVTLLGRLGEGAEGFRYPLPTDLEFRPLPWYDRTSDPVGVARAALGSLVRFWRVLDDADVAILFGPSPLSVGFAILAKLRRRIVVLGVRQDYCEYVERRHPGSRALMLAASFGSHVQTDCDPVARSRCGIGAGAPLRLTRQVTADFDLADQHLRPRIG